MSHGYRAGQARTAPGPRSRRTRAMQAKYGVQFDGFSLIWYRDGDDCQAFHRDRDMRYTEDTLVVILTLGARRPWLLRRRDRRDKWIAPNGGAAFDLSPAGGDLFVLGGRAQHDLGALRAEGPGREQSAPAASPDSGAGPPAPAAPSSAAPTRRRGTSRGGSTRGGAIDPLSNPVWHALGGPHSAFAEAKGARPSLPARGVRLRRTARHARRGRLGRVPRARRSAASPRSSSANRSRSPTAGRRRSSSAACRWCSTARSRPARFRNTSRSAPADVPEMTELVARTEPGPWRAAYGRLRRLRRRARRGRARRHGRRAHATARLHRDRARCAPIPPTAGRGARRRTHARRRGGDRSAWGPSHAARVGGRTRARCGCTSRSASAAHARWSRWRCRRPTDSVLQQPRSRR